MILSDFHLHPQILTRDNFDEFVLTAKKRGIEKICITDHMPLLCSGASDRIPKGRVYDYCKKADELKKQYKDIIDIMVGIEVDWHPTIENEVKSVLSEGQFDLVIGSSHLHAIKNADIFNKVKTRSEYARAMMQNTTLLAKSGYFDAVAHIDMYKWVFSLPDRFLLSDDGFCEQNIKDDIENALLAIKQNGLMLEINPHFAKGDIAKVYPSEYITNMAIKIGIPFYYGSDAHTPQDVGVMLDILLKTEPYRSALV